MDHFTNAVLDGTIAWLTRQVLAGLQHLFGIIHGTLLVSPDLTGLPQVRALTGRSTAIVDATFVLVFLTAAALTMMASGGERARYSVKDLLHRSVVGFIAAHFSQLVVQKATDLAQGLTAAIVPPDLDQTAGVQALQAHFAAAQDPAVDLLMLILLIVICVLFVQSVFQALARFLTLLVLTSIAPIALALHALPHTDPIARLWWRGFLSCLATPLVQAFFLTAGQWMLLDPDVLLPVLGLPVEPFGTLNLMIVVVLLAVTVKIPKLMRRLAGRSSGGGNPLATVVRVIVVGGLSRAIPGVGRIAAKVPR